MKRFLSMLLAVCMLAALLLPTMALAEGVTVLTQIAVTGLPQDVVGKNTADLRSFTVTEGVAYDAAWYSDNGDLYEGTLEMGGTYYLCINLYPEDGYALGDATTETYADTTIDVDDTTAYVQDTYVDVNQPDFGYIEVVYRLAESMAVIQISGVGTPVAGEDFPSTELSVPEGADYSVASAQWYYYDDEEGYIPATGKVVGARDYYLEVELTLPEGYVLDGDTELIFDNEDSNGFSVYNTGFSLDFYVAGESITEVSVNGAPESIEAGQQADVSTIVVPEDANYTLQEAYWKEALPDGGWTEFTGTFTESGVYALNLEFAPADGYQMDVETVLVNGEDVGYYGQSNAWLGAERIYTLTEEITEAEILGIQEPKAGDEISTDSIQVPEDANYSLGEVEWLDADTGEAVTGSFEEGKEYVIIVELIPDEGYHFAENVILGVNGEENYDFWADLLRVEYQGWYSLETLIESVDITIQEPVIGEAPDTQVEVENCTVNVRWNDADGNEVEVFEDDQRYYVGIDLEPADGYRFSGEDTVVTINGQEPNSGYYADDRYAYASNTYSFKDVIGAVTVTVPEVAAGKQVPAEAQTPADANYVAEIYWHVWNAEQMSFEPYEGDTFADDSIYGAEINIYAAVDSYEFDEDATEVTINGAEKPTINVWYDSVYAVALYYLGENDVVEKVELNGVTLPEAGKEATTEDVEIPEDANYELTDLFWMESDTNDLYNGDWEQAETFQEGKYYALVAMVVPTNGYVMGKDVSLYINGQEAELVLQEGFVAYSIMGSVYSLVKEGSEPTPPAGGNNSTTPPMGDNSMVMPLFLLLTLSAAGIVVMTQLKKRSSY